MEDAKGNLDEIEFIHTHEWSQEEIVELYKVGGWWRDHYDIDGVLPILRGSFDFVIAYHRIEKRAVGMGRLISDGVSDGYIQDLVVRPHLRGKGVGRGIVSELLDFGISRGLGWIGLIAEEGSQRFYEKVGFKVFGGTPMIFDQKKEV